MGDQNKKERKLQTYIYIYIYIAQNLIFFIICYKWEKLDSNFGHFLAKHILKIGLPWQQLRSLVTKRYTK